MIYIKSIDVNITALRGTYLYDLPVFRNFTPILLDSPVTFIVGENGSGKSTLIEAAAICAGFNPEGGSKNFSFSTMETHSPLYKHMTLIKNPVGKWRDGYFLRAESFYNVASNIYELDKNSMDPSPPISSYYSSEKYGGRGLHEISHGESFMSLLSERLYGNGLYIFDEPEAALSPSRQLAMLSIIKRLADNNSQFIISTHSPILTAYPGAKIYEISENGLEERNWKMTESYMITKKFLSAPSSFFSYLFEN